MNIPRALFLLLMMAGIVAADYISKMWAVENLKGAPPMVITPYLRLVYVENTGAAFGFLAGQDQRWFLLGAALFLCLVIAVYAWRSDSGKEKFLSALIVGGAIGNIMDRWQLGYVVDFVDAHWGDLHWPAFNVADAAISVGAMCFCFILMFSSPPPKKAEEGEEKAEGEAEAGAESPPPTSKNDFSGDFCYNAAVSDQPKEGATMNALEVTNVCKSYLNVPVLRGLDFSVQQGEFFGFAGINGAGKSTFLKCLLDFCHYESGEISIFGVSSKDTKARARLAFLPERFNPPYYLTGEQFLQMMMKLQNVPYDRAKAEQMLTELDLDLSALNKSVRSFSKGMTQKLGLLGCFLAERDFYILDEPMSGLDPKARALVKRQFKKLQARRATLFFTSHALADIEEVCTRMAVLHEGTVKFIGTPAEMRAQHPGTNSLEECYLRLIGEGAAATTA